MWGKIERQISIINDLLDYKKHKCKEFAMDHGVSIKTIKKDLSELSILYPIMTFQGRNGGVSMYEGFVINGKMLKREQLELLAHALKELSKIRTDPEIEKLLKWMSNLV